MQLRCIAREALKLTLPNIGIQPDLPRKSLWAVALFATRWLHMMISSYLPFLSTGVLYSSCNGVAALRSQGVIHAEAAYSISTSAALFLCQSKGGRCILAAPWKLCSKFRASSSHFQR